MAPDNKHFVIALDFQQHTTVVYWLVHHKELNAQYGRIIHDIDNWFSDNQRIDIPAIVTAKVIEFMNLPTDTDVARLNQMCNSGVMNLRWLTYKPETYCRLNKLAYVIDDAV